VKSARHVTNAAGEALPPFYKYDLSAKSDEKFRVKACWLGGLPSVSGRYGCPSLVESDSVYAVRQRWSMDNTLLNHYIKKVIIPLHPNMARPLSLIPSPGSSTVVL
jgi:hypothetical protein